MVAIKDASCIFLSIGRICIDGNACPDCNPNLLLCVLVVLLSNTQPVDPSSAVTIATLHQSTAHIKADEQQMMSENRLLQAAIEVITNVTMCKPLLLLIIVNILAYFSFLKT